MDKMKKAIITIIIVVCFLITTAVYANNQVASNAPAEKQNPIEQSTEKTNNKSLSEEKIIELCKKGYKFTDVVDSEKLSAICDKTPEEILKVKGMPNFAARKIDKNKREKLKEQFKNNLEKQGYKKSEIDKMDLSYVDDMPEVYDTARSWDDVIEELKIDTQKAKEVLNNTTVKLANTSGGN